MPNTSCLKMVDLYEHMKVNFKYTPKNKAINIKYVIKSEGGLILTEPCNRLLPILVDGEALFVQGEYCNE